MFLKIFKLLAFSTIILFVSCEIGNDNGVVNGTALDVATLQPPVNASVDLFDTQDMMAAQSIIDEDGKFEMDVLSDGTYTLQTYGKNYKKYISEPFEMKKKGKKSFKIYMIPSAIKISIGFLEGVVRDTAGVPLKDVLVSVGSNNLAQTNGYFANTFTNSDGYFIFGVIPLHDTKGDTIKSFAIRAVKEGLKTLKTGDISVNYEEMTTINVVIEKSNSNYTTIYKEDFEDEEDNFSLTGFWHKQHNASIINKAYVDTLVKLAPNDNSGGYIPNAYHGDNCLWYGEESTGNFMGTPKPNQGYFTGGTGIAPNSGVAITPLIDLTGTNEAALDFWSYWEIESIEPNAEGYDWMYISVSTEDNPNNFTQILKLNPYTDPYITNRKSIPYSSGGFNFAPIWIYNNVDLSQYSGKKVYIKFSFSTNDALYNGFRGWFVDDVRVIDIAGKKSNIDHNNKNQIPKRRKMN